MKRLRGFGIAVCACILVYAGFDVVSAQERYSIKQMTPQIEAALNSRRERYSTLAGLKKQGIVGENNRGYVEVLVGTNIGSEEGLVNAENRDRRIIYQAIAEQNNLAGAIATIEKVFAEVQRNNAHPGEKIQTESGTWVTK